MWGDKTTAKYSQGILVKLTYPNDWYLLLGRLSGVK